MTIDEKVRKTLAELGVTDAAGVEALFAEVRAAMERSEPAWSRAARRPNPSATSCAKIFATAGWRARTAFYRSSMKTG